MSQKNKEEGKEKEFEIAFGLGIKNNREERNWSQEDLADLAGIEPNQVNRVERAKHSPTLRTILKLCKALGKSPSELLNVGVKLDFSIDVIPRGNRRRPKTKELLFKLIETGFFEAPRSVDAVAQHCKKVAQISPLKSAISAILKDMVERRKLVRTKDLNSHVFVYKKRGK